MTRTPQPNGSSRSRREQTMAQLADGQIALMNVLPQLVETQTRLAQSQAELQQSHLRLEDSYLRLEESHRQLEERVNRFIETVEGDRIRIQFNIESLNAAVERLQVIITRLLPRGDDLSCL